MKLTQKLSVKQAEMIIDIYKRDIDFGGQRWPFLGMETLET
nr:hypothetical protein [uncultured Cohaesibacter sp.]